MKIRTRHNDSWNDEPLDDRSSEFGATTGHSRLSGFHEVNHKPENDPARNIRSPSRVGLKSWLFFCAALIGIGVWSLVKLTPMVRW